MYFKLFPQIKYILNPASRNRRDESVLITDITRNVRIKKDIIDKITIFEYYTISGNDTYEIVSEKLYGTPYYHWILMLLNDNYDWKDKVLTDENFDNYIIEKFGSIETAKSTIKHYVNSKGHIVDNDYLDENGVLDAAPVYEYDYEVEVNDKKRIIKILPLSVIDVIVKNYKDIISE